MKQVPADTLNAEPFRAFLADMAALGVTLVADGGLRHAVIAARSNAHWWLLPLENRRAAAAGLEMLQPITKAAALAKAVARGLARFGPHGLLGRGHLRLSGLPDLDGAFGEHAAHVACFTGTDGPHRKTALQVMDASGAILGYAKLSRAAHVRPYIRNEAQALRRVAELGLTTADVPKVLSLRDDKALTLLITDSIKSAAHTAPLQPGPDHLRLLEELRTKTEVIGAGETLDVVARQMSALETLAGVEWTGRIARTLARLRPVAGVIPVCLAHGDFTPWNTFVQGGRLYAFDWEYTNATWPVGFDLAHFLLATTLPDRQPDGLQVLQDALASAHFGGDGTAAGRALLLSLVCHAVFYLGRLAEAGRPLPEWTEGPARGAMIDRLLDGGKAGS